MKEKYIEDYVDEMSGYFPEIEKQELERMMKSMATILTYYLKDWYRGFYVGSKATLVEDNKRYKFEVKRVFGKGHLSKLKKVIKTRNKARNGRK